MNIINGTNTRSDTEFQNLPQTIGRTVRLHGSVYKIRRMKGFAFVILQTMRGLVQCVHSESVHSESVHSERVHGDEFSRFPIAQLKEQSHVVITGSVVGDERSKAGYEVRIHEIKILSEPAEEMPVVINGKKLDLSLETLLDFRPITLRHESERSIFKLQEGIGRGFRSFLTRERFTEVHTPKIVYAGAEGGANIFKLDYFGREAYLAQSPQFYKQMMVGVFERVFEIGPVFRAEKHDTSRHLNEYTSVDLEIGYIENFEEIMQTETRMLQHTLALLAEEYPAELSLLGAKLPSAEAIPAIRFHEAKELVSSEYQREIKDFEDFEPEEEKLLSEAIFRKTGCEFVFVTHYPSAKRPFYAMDNQQDPSVTESFDLLFRGMEITTGGQRIHRYEEQVQKMQIRGMDVDAFESYLMIHRYGIPPHGGLGLGLERFTARLLGQNNVRSATLFPRDQHRLTP